MPSAFDADLATARDGWLLPAFGRAVTYTTAAGVATSIDQAMVGPVEDVDEDAPDGRVLRQVREVSISTDDVADPQINATVTIDSVVYAVEAITSQTYAMSTLRVVRIGSREKSRPEYRG